jgi:hypothetical protein
MKKLATYVVASAALIGAPAFARLDLQSRRPLHGPWPPRRHRRHFGCIYNLRGASPRDRDRGQVSAHSHFTDGILRVGLNYQFHGSDYGFRQ